MARDLSHVPPMSERPRCKGCGKALRPLSFNETETVERPLTEAEIAQSLELHRHDPQRHATTAISQRSLGRKFWRYEGYDGFHSLRCALDFATDAYNAGWRRKQKR